MRVFAIADLHLSGVQPKPMEVFGEAWKDYWQKIKKSWVERIQEDDLVLIPGDISWAMTLPDAVVDLNSIAELPGVKLLLRGNHDYWWHSLKKVRAVLPPAMYAIQNDSFAYGGVCICGSRGWMCEGGKGFTAEDEKIYLRELIRLEMSLKSARGGPILAMTHYPPFNEKYQPSGFTKLLAEYGVAVAVYGHLHNRGCNYALGTVMDGVQYHLVSCDYLDFVPKLIWKG